MIDWPCAGYDKKGYDKYGYGKEGESGAGAGGSSNAAVVAVVRRWQGAAV